MPPVVEQLAELPAIARPAMTGSAITWPVAALLAAAVLLAGAPLRAQDAPRAEAPAAAGPPGFLPAMAQVEVDELARLTVREFDWFDARRGRAVPVRLYLPMPMPIPLPQTRPPAATEAGAAAAVPLVVFSHGIGGSRRGYSYLGRHWASQGVASLHLQHVGSDRSLWSGSLLAVAGRLQAAAQESEATARVQDLSFALDQLLAGPLGPRIDTRRIIAAGHSYGANTTLLAVGARVERDGRPLALHDVRLKAAIVISAPPFYGESAPDRILGAITVPSLHITTTDDIIRVPGYYSPALDRVAVFDAIGGTAKTLAVFEGGSHSVFTDRGGTGGVALNPQIKAATQALSMAFMGSVFDGDAGALSTWAQRFGGLLARTSIKP
jgi:dienelactone hydrolase